MIDPRILYLSQISIYFHVYRHDSSLSFSPSHFSITNYFNSLHLIQTAYWLKNVHRIPSIGKHCWWLLLPTFTYTYVDNLIISSIFFSIMFFVRLQIVVYLFCSINPQSVPTALHSSSAYTHIYVDMHSTLTLYCYEAHCSYYLQCDTVQHFNFFCI